MNLLLNQQLQTHTGQVAKSTLQNFTSFHVKGQELRVWKTVLKQCQSCQNKSFFLLDTSQFLVFSTKNLLTYLILNILLIFF